MADSPGFLLFLMVLVFLELGYILSDNPSNIKYFRDFVDVVVVLTIILAAYSIFEYLRASKKIPERACPLQPNARSALKESKDLTNIQIDKLKQTEQFKRFEQSKLRQQQMGHQGGSADQGDKRSEEEIQNFLRELEDKETEIFDE